jgi:thiaminase
MKELVRAETARFNSAKTTPWTNKTVYARYLAQTYHYVVHSTRLLGLAAARLGAEDEKLHHRFLQHAGEERSHHLLAERDLRKLGFELGDFPELPATKALYQTQYYRVEHISAKSLFGYILALEGNAVVYGGYVYDAARNAHGDEAAVFLRVHAEEDPSHLDAAFAAVESFSAEEQARVAENLHFSCAMYDVLLKSIVQAP